MVFPVVRISGPAAAVTAADAIATDVFKADDGNAYIDALLATAQAQIDGPSGWLGRAIGQQTLEARLDGFGWCGLRLPYPPTVSITNVKYDDAAGVERTVDNATYRIIGQPNDSPQLALKPGAAWPSANSAAESVRIQYVAGYATVPTPLKHAIILMAGQLRSIVPSDDGALKARTIEGVGSWTYSLPDGAADAMEKAAKNLLGIYRVYR